MDHVTDYTLPVTLMCVSIPFMLFGFWGLFTKKEAATEPIVESAELEATELIDEGGVEKLEKKDSKDVSGTV